MPSENPSAITRPSWANAPSIAASRSASPHALAIPTEDPSRAGLTNTGVPSTASSLRTAAGPGGQRGRRLGAPAVLADRRVGDLRHVRGGEHLLEDHLVHAQRGGEHARAHVRHVEQLQQPLHRAVLAERAVQRWEDRLGAEQAAARGQRQRLALVHPRAGALDRHRQHLVPGGGDRLAHERGRGQRDVVLGRAPAREDRDPHGAGVALGEGDGVGLAVAAAPTTIVTLLPFGRSSSAAGVWSSTTPTCAGSVTVCWRTRTLKPAPSSAVRASSSVLSETSGTVTALATVRSTAVFLATLPPAAGLWSITVPASSEDSSCVTLPTRRPAPSMALRALSSVSPVTSGTDTFSLPLDTVSVTVVPRSTVVPVCGETEITWPLATVSENAFSTSGLSPSAVSWSWACWLPRPTTLGIATWPGPPETLIVTTEPLSAVVPGRGLWPATVSRGTSAVVTVTTSTLKPSFCRICDAVAALRPITLGTLTCSGFSSAYAASAIAATASRARSHSHQRRPRSSSSSMTSSTGGGGSTSCGAPSSASMNASAVW